MKVKGSRNNSIGKFGKTYLKTVVYFLGITIGITALLSVAFYVIFSTLYKQEVEKYSEEIQSSLVRYIDETFMKQVQTLSLDLVSTNDDSITRFFDEPINNDHFSLMGINNTLKETIALSPQIINNIEIYYPMNDLLVASWGVKYDVSKYNNSIQWIDLVKNRTESSVWLETDESHFVNEDGANRQITLVNSYPAFTPLNQAEGYFAVSVSCDSIVNKI